MFSLYDILCVFKMFETNFDCFLLLSFVTVYWFTLLSLSESVTFLLYLYIQITKCRCLYHLIELKNTFLINESKVWEVVSRHCHSINTPQLRNPVTKGITILKMTKQEFGSKLCTCISMYYCAQLKLRNFLAMSTSRGWTPEHTNQAEIIKARFSSVRILKRNTTIVLSDKQLFTSTRIVIY